MLFEPLGASTHLKSLDVATIVALNDSGMYRVIFPTPEFKSLLPLPSGINSTLILPAPVVASNEHFNFFYSMFPLPVLASTLPVAPSGITFRPPVEISTLPETIDNVILPPVVDIPVLPTTFPAVTL